ncbi:tripartite tricarboxylate transporter TctB family protein [Agaricicola taiwanensis]|nr:tripartite tricarboxylate transporter TctB family protein [Agaricicola taiwanensis]
MEKRGVIDLAGGGFMCLVGLVSLSQSFEYGIGTASEMQAGYFPMVLGIIAIAIGIGIAVPAWSKPSSWPSIPWRPILAIVAALAAFALLIERTGMMPAVFVTVVISTLANPGLGLRRILALSIGVSLTAWLIFSVGFGLPIPAFGSLL